MGCVFLLVAAGVPAEAKAKEPGWLNDLESSYPEAKYLAAVGAGDTRRDAEADASAALAKRFSVQVKVDSVSQKRYADIVRGDKNYTESEESTSQTIGLQSNEQFVNLRYSDSYVDASGRTRVVAFLERWPTAQIYQSLIQKDLTKVAALRTRAQGAQGAVARFAAFDAASLVAMNAERLLAQLRIISRISADDWESKVDFRALAQERAAEAAKLTFRMDIEGDTDGKIAGIVKTTLASMALSSNPEGLLSVKGSWALVPVPSTQYKSLQWTINLSLFDEKGSAIATVFKESKENGVTDAAANALAYREVEKRIKKDLLQSLQDYLTKTVTRD